MIISSRGRYALRLMLDLAENQGDDSFIALKDIAERQELSKKYMEQILPDLSRCELLITKAGHHGGYRLSRKPADYTLGDILRATENSLAPVSCLEGKENSCSRQADCATLPIWTTLDKMINTYLDSVTLQDLLDQQASRSEKSTQTD